MDSFDRFEYLRSESEHGCHREAASVLASSQFRQVATLNRHDDVVEPLVATASNETTHVVFA